MNKLSIKELEAKSTAAYKAARIKTGSAKEQELDCAKYFANAALTRKTELKAINSTNGACHDQRL